MALPPLPTLFCFHSKFISKIPFRLNHSLDKQREWNKFRGLLFWGQKSIFSSHSGCVLKRDCEKQLTNNWIPWEGKTRWQATFHFCGVTQNKLLSTQSRPHNVNTRSLICTGTDQRYLGDKGEDTCGEDVSSRPPAGALFPGSKEKSRISDLAASWWERESMSWSPALPRLSPHPDPSPSSPPPFPNTWSIEISCCELLSSQTDSFKRC